MMRVKPYIFYLQETESGNCLYVDSSGNIQSQSILAAGSALDVSMKHAPDGWMEATLGYSRNTKYYGFNRSYSDPLKMVKDAAFIVRSKYYQGAGVETKLSLLILKYNSQPAAGEPTYKLYHKAPIDFPQKQDKVAESFSCNLLEGGILQMLKTYENTVFQIPCDGSIPENIKVNMDGMFFEDTFNYQLISVEWPLHNFSPATIPAAFISNDGDNIGIVKNSPSFDLTEHPDDYVRTSSNYLMTSARAITVKIKGSIAVAPTRDAGIFSLGYETNLLNADGFFPVTIVPAPMTITFEKEISLAAYENLFILGSNIDGENPVKILGGSMTVTFSSIAADTAPWCITAYDLFKLIIKNINQTASTAFQTFKYGADSTYLQEKLNLVCTSGDAIRASGDPNYQKFYNALQTNPMFPNVNNSYSFGPVIKTSLSDFFTSFNAILNGSLGKQQLAGEGETVFFERKGYVFNSSQDTFDLGEVSDFDVNVDLEKLFTILRIGYPEQQYDQKAGKYECNTMLEMISPTTSIPSKTLEIKSVYRADPYGMERLRSNTDNTSSTKNTSDSSVFVINTDRDSFIYDFFQMVFTSAIPDPTDGANTNLKLIQGNIYQSLPMLSQRAGYFSINNDPAIFVLSQLALSSAWTMDISITGALNGAPGETVTINMYVNGVIVKTYPTTSVSPSTGITVTDTLARTWVTGDTVYFQVSTSANATATITSIGIALNTTYFTASGANIPVDSGTSNKMIAMPTVAAPLVGGLPVLSYGFQYFQFNSSLANPNFTTDFTFSGETNGTSSPGVKVDLFLNGVSLDTYTYNASGAWQPFGATFGLTRDWVLGDVMFVLGSSYSNLTTEFQAMDLKVTSTQIKAYALKRVQYDYISGIPNLCGYVSIFAIPVPFPTAQPITTGPGAPYNIEDLTPKRMLLAWGNYLRSIFWAQQSSELQFSKLDKNQYLVTILGTESITENANVQIGALDEPLFTTEKASFKTRVPLNFDDIMRQSVNAFLSWTYNGKVYYGFAEDMKQKSTLNEMQQWEALIA